MRPFPAVYTDMFAHFVNKRYILDRGGEREAAVRLGKFFSAVFFFLFAAPYTIWTADILARGTGAARHSLRALMLPEAPAFFNVGLQSRSPK